MCFSFLHLDEGTWENGRASLERSAVQICWIHEMWKYWTTSGEDPERIVLLETRDESGDVIASRGMSDDKCWEIVKMFTASSFIVQNMLLPLCVMIYVLRELSACYQSIAWSRVLKPTHRSLVVGFFFYNNGLRLEWHGHPKREHLLCRTLIKSQL